MKWFLTCAIVDAQAHVSLHEHRERLGPPEPALAEPRSALTQCASVLSEFGKDSWRLARTLAQVIRDPKNLPHNFARAVRARNRTAGRALPGGEIQRALRAQGNVGGRIQFPN